MHAGIGYLRPSSLHGYSGNRAKIKEIPWSKFLCLVCIAQRTADYSIFAPSKPQLFNAVHDEIRFRLNISDY